MSAHTLRALAEQRRRSVANKPVGTMKEYRLATWLELRAPFDRIAHRRMLTDMSHRHMTLQQLVRCSGARRNEVRAFLAMLELRGLVTLREAEVAKSMFGALRPLAGWLRRALGSTHIGR